MAPSNDKKKKKPKSSKNKSVRQKAREEIGGSKGIYAKEGPRRYPRKSVNMKMEELKNDNEIATSDVYFCQRQMPKQVWTPADRNDEDFVPHCMRPLQAPLTVYVTKRGNTFPASHDADTIASKNDREVNATQEYKDYGPYGQMPWFESGKRRGVLGYDGGDREENMKYTVTLEPGIDKKRKPFYAGAEEEEARKQKLLDELISAKNEFETKRKVLEKSVQAKWTHEAERTPTEPSEEDLKDFAGKFSALLYDEYENLDGKMSRRKFLNMGGPMFYNQCKRKGDAVDKCIENKAAESFQSYRLVGGSLPIESFMRRGGPLLLQRCIPHRLCMLVDQCIKRDGERMYEMYVKLGGIHSEEEFLNSAGPMLMLLFLTRIKPRGDLCTENTPCMEKECEFTKRYMLKYGAICSYYRSCMLDACQYTEMSKPVCPSNRGAAKCSISKSCMADDCGMAKKVEARQRSLNILKEPRNVCSKDRTCLYDECEWTKLAKKREIPARCIGKQKSCSKVKSCMLDECEWTAKNEKKSNRNRCLEDESHLQGESPPTEEGGEFTPTGCTMDTPCFQDECLLTHNYRIKQKILQDGPCTAENPCMMEECEWTKLGLSRGRSVWNPQEIAKLPLDMSYTRYKKQKGKLSRFEFMWQAGPMSFDEYRNRGGSLTRDEFTKLGVPVSYGKYKERGGGLSRDEFTKRLHPMSYDEYQKRGGSLTAVDFQNKMVQADRDKSGKVRFEDLMPSLTPITDEYYDPIREIEKLDKYWKIYDRIQMKAYIHKKMKKIAEEAAGSSVSSASTSSLSSLEAKKSSSSTSTLSFENRTGTSKPQTRGRSLLYGEPDGRKSMFNKDRTRSRTGRGKEGVCKRGSEKDREKRCICMRGSSESFSSTSSSTSSSVSEFDKQCACVSKNKGRSSYKEYDGMKRNRSMLQEDRSKRFKTIDKGSEAGRRKRCLCQKGSEKDGGKVCTCRREPDKRCPYKKINEEELAPEDIPTPKKACMREECVWNI